MLHLVENTDQIIDNIKTLEIYLNSEVAEDKLFAQDLIKKGRSMMIYKVNGENHFIPSKFAMYKKNSHREYLDNLKRDLADPAAMSQTLLGKPFTHAAIEAEFAKYADTFKGSTLKSKRKYWRVRGADNKYLEL